MGPADGEGEMVKTGFSPVGSITTLICSPEVLLRRSRRSVLPLSLPLRMYPKSMMMLCSEHCTTREKDPGVALPLPSAAILNATDTSANAKFTSLSPLEIR